LLLIVTGYLSAAGEGQVILYQVGKIK